MPAGLRDRSGRAERLRTALAEISAREQAARITLSPELHCGWNVPRLGNPWSGASRVARIGGPKPRRIWPARAPVSRPSSTVAPPSSPLAGDDGLLRQYVPKRTDLRAHSLDNLKHAEQRLNDHPRKVLDWKTTAQVFAAAMPH
jgi:hypothetical protein